MYNRAFLQLQYGYGAALAVILLILCVVLSGVLNKVLAPRMLSTRKEGICREQPV